MPNKMSDPAASSREVVDVIQWALTRGTNRILLGEVAAAIPVATPHRRSQADHFAERDGMGAASP
jgi:hypothetical protein